MPYSQKTKHGDIYDLPSNNGDSICVQHCMKAVNSASPNGRMALVVPEGFLFRKDLARTRELLLKNCDLQSVISLPQGVFLPYTGVKTNIIYATKVNRKLKVSQKRKDFWYFEVKSDGYTLDNHRRKLDKGSDLDKYQEYRKLDKIDNKLDDKRRKEMLDVGFEVVPLSKVKENAYILVGSRYREVKLVSLSTYPLVRLGDEKYFQIFSGGTPDTQNASYWNGDINWITLADLSSENYVTKIYRTERTITNDGLLNSNAKILPIGTVVVSSRATIGRVGIAKTKLATNQGFKNIVIKDHNVILPEYLAFALNGCKKEMLSMASGATFKEVLKSDFEKMRIPLYPLEIQRQIVDELDGYQRIIDNARALVSYRQTVAINPLWDRVKLGDLFDAIGEHVEPQNIQGNVDYIGLENIKSDSGELIGEIKTDAQSIKSAKKRFVKGDILYGRLRPNLNKVYAATFDGICSTDIIVLRPKNTEIMSRFYAILLRSKQFNDAVLNGVSGGQLPRVDTNYFLTIPVYSVPLFEQKKVVVQIETEQALIEPSRELIDVFTKKIQGRINDIWGE
jgi:type I restriction enzyme M protein